MQFTKKAAGPVCAVIKRIFFIGFSIQIVLGVLWMCCNVIQLQAFGKAESALYRGLLGLFEKFPQALCLLQLALAFYAGYRILQKLCPAGRGLSIWGSLALLTFPFAMQCHMAALPYSFMGSLFLLMLSFFLECIWTGGKVWKRLGLAVLCGGLIVILSGALDRDKWDAVPQPSLEAAMASRLAWPSVLNDSVRWPEELLQITEEVLWETTYSPDFMEELLMRTIQEAVGIPRAKEYYLQMAEIAWEYRSSMIIRQIGWDALGYGVTPLIVPLQLKGDAYDSYTSRNYEIMREQAPLLTRYYVDYSCWWFACCLGLAVLYTIAQAVAAGIPQAQESLAKERLLSKPSGKLFLSVVVCMLASGIMVFLYTMRGAGKMDYKCTIAVNELWLVWALLLMRRKGNTSSREE